jgi:hypothetical protein
MPESPLPRKAFLALPICASFWERAHIIFPAVGVFFGFDILRKIIHKDFGDHGVSDFQHTGEIYKGLIMNRTSLITIFSLILLLFSGNSASSDKKESNGMKLILLSDYGSSEKIISNESTEKMIIELIDSLDWNNFYQVIIEKENKDYMEVSGSLDPTDGLSALYQENKKQYVIVNPPKTIAELKKIAISYFKNDKYWKNNIKWN